MKEATCLASIVGKGKDGYFSLAAGEVLTSDHVAESEIDAFVSKGIAEAIATKRAAKQAERQTTKPEGGDK